MTILEWDTEGTVYTTDSSWTATGRHSGRRYHWARSDEVVAACGFHMLDIDFGQAVEDVPESMRCGRPACRARYERQVRTSEQRIPPVRESEKP